MKIEFSAQEHLHLLAESATQPIELRWRRQNALFVVTDTSAPHPSPLGRVHLPFLG